MDKQGKGGKKALKLVLDTNTLISGFLWSGNEAKLLELIDKGKVQLFVSREIIEEIEDVASRTKFKELLLKANLTVAEKDFIAARDMQRAFLQGIVDSNGYITKGDRVATIEITNPALRDYCAELLKSFGIYHTEAANRLHIPIDYMRRFSKLIGFRAREKRRLLDEEVMRFRHHR